MVVLHQRNTKQEKKKMHSTSCNFLPAKLPLPAKILQPAQKLLQPTKIRRVVSITTTPETQPIKSTPVLPPPPPAVDESVAAFWDYQFLFVSQRSESIEPIILRTIDGSIPLDFPSGSYYLIGPGIFSDDHGSTVHPLDGHGYLRAFNINGSRGEVKYSARYVKTEAQSEECDRETGCWKFTHRGPFSVLRGGRKIGNTKVMKNVANTSVVKWGKRLLCLWEGGDPYEIESEMLDTVGKFEMINGGHDLFPVRSTVKINSDDVGDGGGGQKMATDGGYIWDVAARLLKPILYGVFNMPPKRLLSHYKIDPHRDRLITVSCNAEDMLLPRSTFTFYEFDSNFKLLQKQDFNIPDQLMIHDWAFTDTYYILFGNRTKLDVAGSMSAVCGLSPMISALCVNPSKSTSPIYLLPRFTDKTRDWKVPIEAPSQMWLLHIGNAFENRDQNGNLDIQIHAAACSYQWFNFQKMFGYDWKNGKLDPGFMNARDGEENLLPHLVKVSIELEADGNCEKCSVEPLNKWTRPSDFPVINPTYSGSKNTYIYSATTSSSRQVLPHFPFDTVAKLNLVNESVSTWSVSSRRFIGEPVFVSKGVDEDDGYLLVIEYAVSIQRCYLLILDPKRIGEGTDDALVARIEVPKHLNFPLGFHGFWAAKDD